jgi:8-oxo-dGTP diphosphatase
MPAPYCYAYPRPAVTVDIAAFALADGALRVLLIRRKHDPFAGALAFPGGFLEMDEDPETGARRELQEETSVDLTGPFEPLGFYGSPGRDPRGRTISLVFAAVAREIPSTLGGDDASEAAWLPVSEPGPFAFDHAQILADALSWLDEGVRRRHLGPAILPVGATAADVRALFTGFGGSPREADSWLRSRVRSGDLTRLPGSPARYGPASP